MILIDASPNTVDCRLGVLCGCGARYCGIKCLVAAAQAHKSVCESIQSALQALAESRFRATETTNQAAFAWDGPVQTQLLRADMVVAAPHTAFAFECAAEIVRLAGALELAQKFAQRALSLSAKGSLVESMALHSLGLVAEHLSNYDAAVAHYEAALKIKKSLPGDDRADVARTCIDLTRIFRQLGRLDEALAMGSYALDIYEKAPGDHRTWVAHCHNNIANILTNQGRHEEAMEHRSTGLAITLKADGETALAAAFLINIGADLMDQNKLDEAMEKYVSALRISEKAEVDTTAKVDTTIAQCHHNIGTLLMKQGKLDDALEHARKSLAISQSKLSHEHADCGQSHCLIGDILRVSGKFAEALDEFDNALRIRKNVFGEMTLKVADVYESKATCLVNLRKWREAVTFYEAAIHIPTVLLGADDAELVDLKARLGEAEEALKAERSSAAASEQRK
jgi:tetratricopeptide (TPR) repeat protein